MVYSSHICHLTSVHSRFDVRIFLKECRSLVNAGCRVTLIVADGKGDEVNNQITIIDARAPLGRINRMATITRRIFLAAKALDAAIYHLHDPELIPVGLKLKGQGAKVVFDAHEDVPLQILSKPYMNKPAKYLSAGAYSMFEKWACRRFDAIVAATPFIRDKFLKINQHTVDVNNYPIIEEWNSGENELRIQSCQVCYIGGIASVRGVREIVQAMQLVDNDDARLKLAGRYSEPLVEREIKKYLGWSKVDDVGWLDREGVRRLLTRSAVGLVTLHPLKNYLHSLPVKMFEYMVAGIPVIASDFPLWRRIIQETKCGLWVDPMDPKSIAMAIDWLLAHRQEAKLMGENGRKAVENKYNWRNEEQKLIAHYRKLTA